MEVGHGHLWWSNTNLQAIKETSVAYTLHIKGLLIHYYMQWRNGNTLCGHQ